MKNVILLSLLFIVYSINANAQFTTVNVHLQGACMTPNSNSRYVIKVEIHDISTSPATPVITPVITQFATEGFPVSGNVTIPINQTVCTEDGLNHIYKVYVSAAKVWVPNGQIECQGKADAQNQLEYNCYGIVYTMPYATINVQLN